MKNTRSARILPVWISSVVVILSMMLAMLGGSTISAAASRFIGVPSPGKAGGSEKNTGTSLTFYQATRKGNRLLIDWSTGAETGIIGFNLYVEQESARHKLNDQLIPSKGSSSHVPQDYQYETSAGSINGQSRFTLEEVDILGRAVQHGPFMLDKTYGMRMSAALTDWQKIKARHADLQASANAANSQAVNRALQERMDSLGSLAADVEPETHPDDLNVSQPYTVYLPLIMRQTGSTPVPSVRVGDLLVSQTGIQRVSFADLLAAGLDLAGQPASDIALTLKGQPVPISFTSPGTFGPGSFFEFYGQALDTLYTDTNIYTLWVDPALAQRVNEDRSVPNPSAKAASYYLETALVDNNTKYSELSTTGDPWYDTRMVVYTIPKSWNYPLIVDHYLAGMAPVSLRLNGYGGSDFNGSPDHHVVTSFNGTQVADQSFGGLNTFEAAADLSGLLSDGTNTLNLQLPGDTGKPADVVYLDRYSVDYPRSFWAVNGGLKFDGTGSVFEVENLLDGSVTVYRLQNGTLTRLDGAAITAHGDTYTARFSGSGQAATYLVVGSSAVLKPGIRAARVHTDITFGSAEYLVISHPDFIGGLTPLVQARTTQGLSVRVVDVFDIYEQYNHGVVDPLAIKKYISYAARNMGSEYVLLVGDDTYDYKNQAGTGSISFIPSIYMAVGDMVQFAPVDPKYADLDDDNLPDLAIGRFAVRTPAELDNMVNKTLVYAGKTYGKTGLFAADSAEDLGYTAASNDLLAGVPADWTNSTAHLDTVGLQSARETLLARLTEGVALTSFVGHTSDLEWTWDPLFSVDDALELTNYGRPTLIVQEGCWNNYYVNPRYETLQDALLNDGLQGAVGMFGSTTLTFTMNEQAFGVLFIPLLTQPGMTIGQAEQQAKRDLAATQPGALDVFLGMSLLGDPALVVSPGR